MESDEEHEEEEEEDDRGNAGLRQLNNCRENLNEKERERKVLGIDEEEMRRKNTHTRPPPPLLHLRVRMVLCPLFVVLFSCLSSYFLRMAYILMDC